MYVFCASVSCVLTVRCASRIFIFILNTCDELRKCYYLCLQAGNQYRQVLAKFTSTHVLCCPMKFWSPNHLHLLPGLDHVSPPHHLIFPGFPSMKTRVSSGRTDMYLVFALVWMWDRVRVQKWTWEHGSFPVPSAYAFPSGWGEAGSLTKTGFPISPERMVQEQKY